MKAPFKGSILRQLAANLCWEVQRDPLAEWMRDSPCSTSEIEKERLCFVFNRYPKRLASISGISVMRPTRQQEEEFRRLVQQWRRDVMFLSSIARGAGHPAYQKIVKMGFPMVPLLLRELEQNGGHWFVALRKITGKNPVEPEDAGSIPNMTKAWIEWGHKEGYLQ